MQWRNPTRNAFGTIDVEINHPVYGWIPFTADPTDTGAQFDVAALVAEIEAGEVPNALPPPPPDPRAAMVCSRLQGRLVLGPETCAAIDALAVDPATPWAMRETITNAIEWRRTSQAMTELGYLLGYGDDQMDELFIAAMDVAV